MAWSNLDRRKGRTALTAAGVVIGVASLVLMVSLGLGLQKQVVQMFETDESLRTLRVHRVKGDAGKKKSTSFGFGFDSQMIPLTDKDLEDIRKLPGVAGAWPELDLFLRLAVDGSKGLVHPVEGIAPEEEGGYAKHLVAGAMWTRREERVCLVPKALAESRLNLAPADAIGRKITFSSFMQEEGDALPEDEFTIVGVLGDEAFSFMGRPIIVPLERGLTLRERKASHPMLPSKKGSYLFARLRLTDPRASADVAARLRNLGFNPLSAVELLKQINVVFLVLEAFMACVGGIGLVVSLFGIANTMAMAVLERTREIGIMKALGARNGDIGRLFLAEAGGIGALGGVVGLAGGVLIGKLLNAVAHLPAFEVPENVSLFHVSYWLAGGSVLFSILVSIVAGWIPARRAARMEPVAAVRYE
ncbi:MAG: ABC transporter permease [Planctomycetes bacterium]|nr:ABC transporter permease [Planctomycetota bacterium]